MKCPLCSVDLVMSERQGIEIDYCPQCRGVWHDRGELDKIIERASAAHVSPCLEGDRRVEKSRDYDRGYGRDRRYDHDNDYDRDRRRKKKRGGFLEDLFEFGD